MGIALASYTSDYNDYVPFNVTWDLSNCYQRPYQSYSNGAVYETGYALDLGVYKDAKGVFPNDQVAAYPDSLISYGGTYGQSGMTAFPPQGCGRFLPRVIAQGMELAFYPWWPPNFGIGKLCAAPQGLGFLAADGYLPDLGVFFCPSSPNMPDDEMANTYAHPIMWGPYREYEGATSIADCKAAGGTSADILTHGSWGTYYPNTGPGALGADYFFAATTRVESTYAYRCAGVYTPEQEFILANPTLVSPYIQGLRLQVPWTKPGVWHDPQLPFFKTLKQLGGRAIVADGYERHYNAWVADTYNQPGDAWWGHRDGYNILYGDFSARWYGDPQARIMWYPPPASYNQESTSYQCDDMSGSTFDGYCSNLPNDPNEPYYWGNIVGSQFPDVWHLFDVANGIDVDAVRGR
jgi:hypothetical protein